MTLYDDLKDGSYYWAKINTDNHWIIGQFKVITLEESGFLFPGTDALFTEQEIDQIGEEIIQNVIPINPGHYWVQVKHTEEVFIGLYYSGDNWFIFKERENPLYKTAELNILEQIQPPAIP